ncbi:DEAD/DEAH box helicase [Myxococcota bacterium]|nr:DEAD/DEAH box helicase [Myxococcota bacterium]MBU1534598.1 DEAD/DEAH box helicase [Myxococcota bacterium]
MSDHLHVLTRGEALHSFQEEAVNHLSESRRHLMVEAAPGRGKSLIAVHSCLMAATRGERALWLVPLRELVREKATLLRTVSSQADGSIFPNDISEGLGGEVDLGFSASAITVATYEWCFYHPSDPPGLLVIDEAQELSDPQRGSLLAKVVLAFLSTLQPPRIVLLGHGLAKEWSLMLPQVIAVVDREPPAFDLNFLPGHNSRGSLLTLLEELLTKNHQEQIALFVSHVKSACTLAPAIHDHLTDRPQGYCRGPLWARAFHAGLPREEKEEIITSLHKGTLPIVVSTTALAKGIDLPLTTVIVRDLHLPGRGSISVNELNQLGGRCGRRGRRGKVYVLRGREKTGRERHPDRLEILGLLLHFSLMEPKTVGELLRPWEEQLDRTDLASLFSLLDRYVALGTIVRKGDLLALSSCGRILLESELPVEKVSRWIGFFREVGRFSPTPFDLFLLYATVFFPTGSFPREQNPTASSTIWDRWLSRGMWEQYGVSLSLKKPLTGRQREYLLGYASALMSRVQPGGETPRGFSTLEKLATTDCQGG